MFGAYGQEWQAISAQLAAWQNEFTQTLTAAVNAYANAEAASTAALVQGALSGLDTPTSPPALPAIFNEYMALVMGGTGEPIPDPITYIPQVNQLFIQPNQPGAIPHGSFTPEQLYPITGIKSLPFAASVQEGLSILDSAIWQQLNAGNHVTVFGYSQSAVIALLEMQHLISLGPMLRVPTSTSRASFPNAPGGSQPRR